MKLQEPLLFEPVLHEKIWGGTRLHELLQKGDGTQSLLGETWELIDQEKEGSVVVKGTFQGKSLRELVTQYGDDIYGLERDAGAQFSKFPLLYKFIHANAALSVQVHPGENSLGDAKTEMWYVLEAPENASIIVGLKSQEKSEYILSKLTTSDAPEVLNYIPVKSGDVFFIPSGTVHAITEGLVVYEVQQSSDTTFRLYDWDRVDSQGRGRELHVQEASEVIDYRVHQKHKINPLVIESHSVKTSYLVACTHFALKKYEFDFTKEQETIECPLWNESGFKVISVIKGKFKLHYGANFIELVAGETVLLPFSLWELQSTPSQSFECPVVVSSSQSGFFLESFVPCMERDVMKPLEKAGYTKSQIQDLGGIDGLV